MPAPSVLAFEVNETLLDLGALDERMRELPPGMVLSPLGERPDIAGADLDEVADGILATAG